LLWHASVRCAKYIDLMLTKYIKFSIALLFLLLPQLGFCQGAELESRFWDNTAVIDAFRTQNEDFFRLVSGEEKNIEFRYDTSSKRRFSGSGNATFSEEKLKFAAEVPIPLSKDFFLRVAPLYEVKFLNFDNLEIDNQTYSSEQLHRVELGLGFGHFVNEDSLFTIKLIPGLHSNFSSIDGNHFQLFSQGFFVYRANENLEFILGTVSSELFDEAALYPVIGLRARALEGRLHIKLTPPIELRLGYDVSNVLQFFGGFWLSGNQHRIETLGESFQIQTQDRRLGVGLVRRLNEKTNFQLDLGVLLKSEFEFELVDTSLDTDNLEESFYAGLTIGYDL